MEAVVVDAGSKLLKAGPAIPDQAPSMIIPNQMKRVPDDGSMNDNSSLEDIFVDPVVRGLITDWDAMENLLHHVLYTGLGWEMGNEGQILFTDPLCTPKAVREQLVQLMFETFNISGFYASEQAVLSLYAVGRISGCTVDIGHGKIDIAPVIEGAVQHIASRRFEIGGTDLTKLLAEELGKSNPQVNIKMSDIEKIKEQYSCCAEDELAYEKTKNSCQIEQHTLPDGQVITIGRERYTVGEALFQPSILGLEAHGIVEQLVRCISTVSSDNHRQLLENTVLCGGTASMTGFEERFQKEAGLCSSAVRPALIKPPEYMPENLSMYSAWVGGAILAKVVFPQNQHVTKADYDETGPSVIIVEKSTLPIDVIENHTQCILAQNPLGTQFSVFYNPDFLSQGTVVHDVRNPSHIAIVEGICKCLSKEGCDKLTIYDAKARREDIVRSPLWRAVFNKRVEIVVEAHRAWEGAHAIVFLVDSYEFEELPWGNIHETMGKPPFIFVGCNLNLNTVRTLGFNQYIS
ncbi:hypothetical protein C1H46_001327 [Malus baccata]|uniref:Actin-related protein 7 n=1 Tax=Malus baccata TaxID=106549 RepID=A0A540NPJ7_MALBA|nr:hypothetical protein C1H46_001327 [Malus baccata]